MLSVGAPVTSGSSWGGMRSSTTRGQTIFRADAFLKESDGLVHVGRQAVQPREPVAVVLEGGEAELLRELAGVLDAGELAGSLGSPRMWLSGRN